MLQSSFQTQAECTFPGSCWAMWDKDSFPNVKAYIPTFTGGKNHKLCKWKSWSNLQTCKAQFSFSSLPQCVSEPFREVRWLEAACKPYILLSSSSFWAPHCSLGGVWGSVTILIRITQELSEHTQGVGSVSIQRYGSADQGWGLGIQVLWAVQMISTYTDSISITCRWSASFYSIESATAMIVSTKKL